MEIASGGGDIKCEIMDRRWADWARGSEASKFEQSARGGTAMNDEGIE